MVLSVDFAFRCSGYVVIANGKPVDQGLIKTKPIKNRKKRTISQIIKHEINNSFFIENELGYLISNYEVDHVIVEIPYFSQKANDAILIGMGWGLLKNFHAEMFTGEWVKEELTGKGSAAKNIVATKVTSLLMEKGISFDGSDHEYDAMALYLVWSSPQHQLLRKLQK